LRFVFFYRNERNENARNAKHDSSKPTLLNFPPLRPLRLLSDLCGLFLFTAMSAMKTL